MAAGLVLAVTAAPAAAHPSGCTKTFSIEMFRKAAITVYAGKRIPSASDLAHLKRYESCSRHTGNRAVDERIWARSKAANAARRAPPMFSAVASVYDAAGGPIACRGDSYAMGVANKSLPCGTRLLVCYRGCVQAVVFDRGPYIGGRDFDLSRAVEGAVGFPDGVATIRYRILP